MTGRGRPALEKPARDEEVLETTERLFYERGYTETSIQAIADSLGILKGSVYHYARTKEDLLYRIVEHIHEDLDAMLRGAERRDDLQPLERLAMYVRAASEYNVRNRVRMTVYTRDVERLSDDRRERILRRRADHDEFVTDQVRLAQQDGVIDKDLEAEITRNFVLATITHYRWYRSINRSDPKQIADLCVRFIIGGLTAGPESAL